MKTLMMILACVLVLGQASRAEEKDLVIMSSSEEEGTTYQTMPMNLFENEMTGEMQVYFTYKENEEDATLYLNYVQDKKNALDSVAFMTKEGVVRGNMSLIYEGQVKGDWVYRYSMKVPASQLLSIFDVNANTRVLLCTSQKVQVYKIKSSEWKKAAPAIENALLKMPK